VELLVAVDLVAAAGGVGHEHRHAGRTGRFDADGGPVTLLGGRPRSSRSRRRLFTTSSPPIR